ncbi:MAG: hypothetical protein ABIY55_04900 [Kofleriaceae bacterium]
MRLALCLMIALAGCVGPQASDRSVTVILPAGADVPEITSDAVLAAQIASHDNIDGVLPLVSAFADGQPVHVWDFGIAPRFAAPLLMLMRRDENRMLTPVAHPTIADALPGDRGYSPFWATFVVEVTDRYAGEQLTSLEAVDEAIDRGLALPPVATDDGVNCPVTAGDARIAVGAGQQPIGPNGELYVRGLRAHYYDLGPIPLMNKVRVPEAARYILHRTGEDPLSEPSRGVDMTGDGDTLDTNDVYTTTSPLARTVRVTVAAGTMSIDSSHNEAVADLRTATQLFNPMPVAATVLAYESTADLHDVVMQRTAGGL